jgi:hypothetical protein
MVRSDKPLCSAATLTEKLMAISYSFLDFLHSLADTCIDMKVNKHINTTNGAYWYRCKSVKFDGDTAFWELDSKKYDLMDSYHQTPHHQLLKATDEGALRDFVRTWGPLRHVLNEGSGGDSIESYRTERDRLIVVVQLLTSVADVKSQRSAIQALGEFSHRDVSVQALFRGLRGRFQFLGHLHKGFDEDVHQWLETAMQKDLEDATELLVSNLVLSASIPSFTVERNKRGSVVVASLGIRSLPDALSWMVWQDWFMKKPFQFCEDCRKLFQPPYLHERKFCSEECAHRKASRESARRKRQERKNQIVTQKAR